MRLNRYLKNLRNFVRIDPQQRRLYIEHPDRDFTRSSPLTFSRTATLILGLLRKSLAIELFEAFFSWGELPVTKSAFSQRRKLIKPAFFRDLFHHSALTFYRCFPNYRRWRGKRIFGVDGTGQTLPNETWIGEAFGFHKNQYDQVPSTRILLTFDLLNKIIYRVDLHTQKSAEIKNAYPNVEQLPKDAIYIYDRGYQGYGLPFLHRRHGSDCVIRLSNTISPEVEDFVQSTDNERFITIRLRDRAFRTLRDLKLDPQWNHPIDVRLVKVKLPTGEIEVLLTTLMDRRKYHYKRIGELYGWRWGVETAIHVLKSFLQLALISAYTQPGVGQDLWASFLFYNQQSTIIFALDDELKQKTKNRQYRYQINRNVTAGLVKRWLRFFYQDSHRKWRSRTQVLLKECIRHLEPYRSRPSRERKRRIMRGQDRHVFEYNYRSGM